MKKPPRLPTRLSSTERLILELLAEAGSTYGLDLVTRSGGRLKRGTVYVMLGRMEQKGLVRCVVDRHVDGHRIPRRRYEPSSYALRLLKAWDGMLRELRPERAR